MPARSLPETREPDARRAAEADASRFLLALPKADLHCHLDGSLRPRTILELARERRVRLPADTLQGLLPFVRVAPTCRSLKEFLDVFHWVYPLLRDAAALERVAYELCEDCAAENIRHVEVRFAPTLNASEGFDTDAVVAAVLKGLRRGLKDTGVTSGVILCLFRSHGPKENRKAFGTLKRAFRATNGLAEPGVVGMDLAGDEARYPTLKYADFYDEARGLGIPTTCHAGETVGTANLRAALELQVKRIGHGIHLMEDPRLQQEVIRRGVPLEIGITSNVRTKAVPSLRAHPAAQFHRAGVKITLNTDDRGIIGIDLTHEYRAARKMGFTLEQLARIAAEAVDHLFLPLPDRECLRLRFDSEIRRLPAGTPT